MGASPTTNPNPNQLFPSFVRPDSHSNSAPLLLYSIFGE